MEVEIQSESSNINKFLEVEVFHRGNDIFGKISIEKSFIEKEKALQLKEIENNTKITKTTSGSDDGSPGTIIILDRSGSMGSQVERLYNKIIPGVLLSLGYKDDSEIHVITFDSETQLIKTTVKEMTSYKISCRGCTRMQDAIVMLEKTMAGIDKQSYRVLSISDGEIEDQEETLKLSSKLAEKVKEFYQINSQAIRLFTSGNQPSTKGLSSVLQFNTVCEANLIDISTVVSDDQTISMISELFANDNISSLGTLGKLSLNCKSRLFKENPWNAASTKIKLKEGVNTFWFSQLPTENEEITVEIGNNTYTAVVSFKKDGIKADEFFDELLKNKVNYYFNQIKILKIINTTNSKEEISKILSYFKEVDEFFNNQESNTQLISSSSKLGARIDFFRQVIKKREKSVFSRMNEIANDDKVNQLNSAQQADYLRNTELTKVSKALAKRAVGEGLDFNVVAREEAKMMRKHFDEIKDIDDSNHLVSFYSTCTTLDGVRAICEVVDNGLIDSMEVNDIIKLLNIVGIGCDSPIGDYPDPMVWRVRDVFPGCFISLSDVLVAFDASGGKALVDVGSKRDIVNVIPVFEDDRLHRFYLKYASTLLEYTSSIGMRRLVAHIPLSYPYTLCAGLLNLIQLINKYKSDISIRTFCCLTKSFEVAIGTMFDYVVDLIGDQDPNISYYIGNNGMTNMMSPLIKIIKNNFKNGVKEIKYVDRVLRALYSFEIYQVIRKVIKGENPGDAAKEVLRELLGIDFEKYGTKLPPMYEVNENPTFHRKYYINESKLEPILKKLWYLDHICEFTELFKGVYINHLDTKTDNPNTLYTDYSKEIEYIRNIPTLNDEVILSKIKIDYTDVKKFKFFNIVQSLLNYTKADRVDDDNKKMKIIELDKLENAEKMVEDYVQTVYHRKYLADLLERSKEEKSQLATLLTTSMLKTENINEFTKLFREGMEKGPHKIQITDSSKLGYSMLSSLLLNTDSDVPLRFKKLRIVLYGTDEEGKEVWNNGKPLRTKLEPYKDFYYKQNMKKEWDDMFWEMKKLGGIHIYRDLANRHGHGNSKPSYWAFGFDMLVQYKQSVGDDDWKNYTTVHSDCCGVKRMLGQDVEYEQKAKIKEERNKQKMLARKRFKANNKMNKKTSK